MKKRRFLKVITFVLISGLGILISISGPARAQLVPVSSNISLVYPQPFGITTLNSSAYLDMLSRYTIDERSLITPFESHTTLNMSYADMMANLGSQTYAYSNLAGINYQDTREFYFDPVVSATGQHRSLTSPYGGFSSETAMSTSPGSIATHVSRELSMPWFYYGTAIDTVQGAGLAPSMIGGVPVVSSQTNVSHASYGLPMATDILPGMSNHLRGILALETYGSAAAAMNTSWGWDYAYTKEGMAFVPNFAYYNEANETGWYFGADLSQVQTGTETGPGISTGYTFINEAPETLAAGAGLFGLVGLGPVIPIGSDGLLEGGDVLFGGGPFFIGAPFLMGAPLAFGGAPLFGSGVGPGLALGIGGGGAIEGGFVSGVGITYGGIPGLMW